MPEKYRGLNDEEGPRGGGGRHGSRRTLLAEVEDREIDLAHSDRSKTPIEPYLADQWFVKMDELVPENGDGCRQRMDASTA